MGLPAIGVMAAKVGAKLAGSKALGTAATTLGITGMNQFLADRAFRKEKEWWKEQFDYSAKYDTPAAQMARMKEAGLNPALMYGGSGSIEGAPSPSGGGPEAAKMDLQALSMISAQVENIRKDSKLKEAQQELATNQGVTELAKGKLTSSQAKVAEGLVQTNMDLTKAQLDIKREELVGKKIDNYIKDETKAEQVKNIVYSLLNAQATLKGQQLKNVEQEKLNELLKIGVTPGGMVGDILTFLGNLGINIYKQF